MHLLWLSWELWTLNKSEFSPRLPLVILMHSPTLRRCFRSVSAVTDAQTVTVKKNKWGLGKDVCAHCVLFDMLREGFSQWRPGIQLARWKETRARSETEGSLSHPSNRASLPIATTDGGGDERGRRVCAIPVESACWGWETALARPWNTALSTLLPADKYQFNCPDTYCRCTRGPAGSFLG